MYQPLIVMGLHIIVSVVLVAVLELSSGESDNSSVLNASSLSNPSQLNDTRNSSVYVNGSGICQSIDVRNEVSNLDQLRGCRLVEGFVQIVLIDYANETDYEDFSFPELQEITHYLLLHRVTGLRSIGQLFPSLTRIRGNSVFVDYSLVIYQMYQLHEIGLKSLREISRGAVRIEKNPNLCFFDTINWEFICRWNAVSNYISQNRHPSSCPGSSVCEEAGCPQALCWTRNDCQLQINDTSKDCHPECLRGCYGPGANACISCRKYLNNGECVSTCPNNTYLLLEYQCVTKEHCLSLENKLSEVTKSLQYGVFNNSCVQSCPHGYDFTSDREGCVKCDRGKCPKLCPGQSIDSIAAAQNLKGCTIINGSLEISIKHGKHELLAVELEESLKSVEVITGYLKIFRSYALVNLKFLKNLEVIHGKAKFLENKKYSLIVMDNTNLIELWNVTDHGGLKILNGSILFHYNPKLCFHHIELLISVTGLKNISDFEVAPDSNGDKFACHKTDVDLVFTRIMSTSVIINISLTNETGPQPNLQRFVLYYTEASSMNMTYFEETDECDSDSWKIRDILTEGENQVLTIQTFLKPNTLYAFYVKTYTIHSIGGLSTIHYKNTLPTRPSEVVVTLSFSNSSSNIFLQWEPPLHPNGNISKYIISGYRHLDDPALLSLRDYCQHPMVEEEVEVQSPVFFTRVKNESKCYCPENEIMYRPRGEFGLLCVTNHYKELSFEPDYPNDGFNCNKYLYNYTYQDLNIMNSRYPDNTNVLRGSKSLTRSKFIKKKPIKNDSNYKLKIAFFKVLNDTTATSIRNLSHFAKYTISIRACREKEINNTKDNYRLRCSKSVLVTLRTLKNSEADTIQNITVAYEIVEEDALGIRWVEPDKPNGMILAFEVEHKRSDLKNAKAIVECITYLEYKANGSVFVLRGLLPGKYKFRIRAVSLAGKGVFTDYFKFEIEKIIFKNYHKLLLLSAATLIIVSICGSYYILFLKPPGQKDLDKLLTNAFSEDITVPPYNEDTWEIPRENVQMLKELGKGSFGTVYEGVLFPGRIPCAVKSVTNTSPANTRAFLNETCVMKRATGVHHIVQLLGVVSRGNPPLVIMELIRLGDLKSYLRSSRDIPLPDSIFLKMSVQIADAMVFMEKNKFVHRDLATRNCLLQSDLTVKVGDFGLTCDIHSSDYYQQGERILLPIRWMAPESLRDGLFSSRSDIWSYGVVLWEIATLAELPYQGLGNEEVVHRVIEGLTPSPPSSCPALLKKIMLQCWTKDPLKRPSFLQIITHLERYTDDLFKCVSYYHTSVLNSQRNINIESQHPQVRLIY